MTNLSHTSVKTYFIRKFYVTKNVKLCALVGDSTYIKALLSAFEIFFEKEIHMSAHLYLYFTVLHNTKQW